MPPHHVEITETVIALKKKLQRDREASTSQPITSATNRGNKLKRGAQYVHAGALPYKTGPEGYKERISHAGYQRYILDRNPKRYNEVGDQLDDSDDDPDADADAEVENPYSDVRLEEILRPLTHPAELANHPTMRLPYLDPALPDMVKDIEAQLRAERYKLSQAKALQAYFIGDEPWLPNEKVEDPEDWDLFSPHRMPNGESQAKRRRLSQDRADNHIETHDQAFPEAQQQVAETNGVGDGQPPKSESDEAKATESVPQQDQPMADADQPTTNGGYTPTDQAQPTEKDPDDTLDLADENGSQPSSPVASPPRRITRALAAETNTNTLTNPSRAGTPTSTIVSDPSLLEPAATFLLPAHLRIAHTTHLPSNLPMHVAHSGLSPDSILETRKLLGMFIQKSEETVRGLEGLFAQLVKLKRRKEKVWEWANAEGHLGEMSDGEDWVDTKAWGLEKGELRKGRDEEEGAQQVGIELDGPAEIASGPMAAGERRRGKRKGKEARKPGG